MVADGEFGGENSVAAWSGGHTQYVVHDHRRDSSVHERIRALVRESEFDFCARIAFGIDLEVDRWCDGVLHPAYRVVSPTGVADRVGHRVDRVLQVFRKGIELLRNVEEQRVVDVDALEKIHDAAQLSGIAFESRGVLTFGIRESRRERIDRHRSGRFVMNRASHTTVGSPATSNTPCDRTLRPSHPNWRPRTVTSAVEGVGRK